MNENKEITSSDMYQLMRDNYTQFDKQAIDIFAHLLEICGVSVSVDLVASISAASTLAQTRGAALTQLLSNKVEI